MKRFREIGDPSRPERMIAIDVGAGTQDILIYEHGQAVREPRSSWCCRRRRRSSARRIRQATAAGSPIHLAGTIMGGGASSDAVKAHLAAGLPVTATPSAARTMHNDLDRVRSDGNRVAGMTHPTDARTIELGDVDPAGLRAGLERFGVELPDVAAIAVQDHGFRPGSETTRCDSTICSR